LCSYHGLSKSRYSRICSADVLHTELKKSCDYARKESFICHPTSFLHFMKVIAITYIIATVCLLLEGNDLFQASWVLTAAIIYSIGVIMGLSQFVFYFEFFDRFYFRALSYNVSGTIEPKEEIRQQILVSGHHDSAYIFNFLEHASWQKFYALRIIAGMVMDILGFLLSWIWYIVQMAQGSPPFFAMAHKILAVIGIIFAIQFYFFTGNKGVPGAGDNLIASAIAVKLAEIYGKRKKAGLHDLNYTRLVFMSCDAEEAGLRGSRAYVKAHRKELQNIPTYFLNLDSLYTVKDIQVCTTDINSSVRLSEKMALQVKTIAEDIGYPCGLFQMKFGGGATDAASFAQAGVDATTILGLSTDTVREGLVYHTTQDTIDKIEPEIVEAVMRIICQFISKKDNDISIPNSIFSFIRTTENKNWV
jgi:aminopeptidase YwaD